jgi:PAS domain S-box-containing protein
MFIVTIRDITERKKAEKAMQFMQFSIDHTADAAFWMGEDARFTYVNDAACRSLGYSRKELLNMSVHDIDPDFPAEVWPEHWKEVKKRGSFSLESHYRTKKGRVFPVEITVNYLEFGGKEYNCAFAKDITERKRTEEELQAREAYLDQLIETAQEAIVMADNTGKALRINQEFTRLFGYAQEEAVGQNLDELIVPQKLQKSATLITEKVAKGEKASFEAIRRHKSGRMIAVSVLASPIVIGGKQVGTYGIYRNITERKKAEEQIKASLKEKEILLQEVHHRVKNNMQIISSLLNLQSRHVKDKESLGLFKSSQNRVKSMALIHERLYQSKDFTRIDVADYVQNLTNHLFITYGISKDAVKLKMNIKDIFLDINTAIPCALIINELVSNSLKHAFPNGKKGEIQISMSPLSKDEIELVVGDNGVGMLEDANLKNTKSLGLYLVSMLAEDQLHGEIKLDKTEGTAFRFRLRVKK